MAIETRGPRIHGGNFGGFGSVTFESQALPHLVIPRFLRCTCVGIHLGHHFLLGAFAEGVRMVLNYPLFHLYKFMVLAGRKTKLVVSLLNGSLYIYHNNMVNLEEL